MRILFMTTCYLSTFEHLILFKCTVWRITIDYCNCRIILFNVSHRKMLGLQNTLSLWSFKFEADNFKYFKIMYTNRTYT